MIKFLIIILSFLVAQPAKAVCPVCTVAVGAGVGLSRWLGVDDLITGIWLGGLTVSVIFWTLDWLNKKQINFILKKSVITVSYYVLIFASLHFPGILWHPLNTFWGVDKILFGIIAGSLIFLITVWFNNLLKTKNQGKVYFSYQKVVIPVSLLLIFSLIFYFIIL